jgi:hypothetical protein
MIVFEKARLARKVILPEPDLPEKYFSFNRPTRPMQDYDLIDLIVNK